MTSDSRAKFEEWASGFGWRSNEMTRRQDSYADHAVSLQWQSWVAGWSARDSEVERLREALTKCLGAWDKPTTLAEQALIFNSARAALSSQVKESGK